jgi:hypothetical protein
MSCGNLNKGIASTGQSMVDQTPRFERKPIRQNQVLDKKSGIIRKDKRKKVHYL